MKRFKDRILPLVAALFAILAPHLTAGAAMPGAWKVHTPFHEKVHTIADTPSRTYFLGHAQLFRKDIAGNDRPLSSLFMYDKESDETIPLNSQNILSENVVLTMAYNAQKEYLLVVYDNLNIDLIFDSGEIANIQDLMAMPGDKDVVSITFDAQHDLAFIATTFGYVALNDVRAEVAESRNYGRKLDGVARSGDTIFVTYGDKAYQAKAGNPRFTLEDYEQIDMADKALYLLPLNEDLCAVQSQLPTARALYLLKRQADGKFAVHSNLFRLEKEEYIENRDGYLVPTTTHVFQLTRKGGWKRYMRQPEDKDVTVGSWDYENFWFGEPIRGFRSKKVTGGDNTTAEWVLTRDFSRPDAPAVFRSNVMSYSPVYGLLVNNHGTTPYLTKWNLPTTILLSGLKDGRWEMHGIPYTNPQQKDALYNPNSALIDPDDPKYIYCGSHTRGLMRINLEDPADILRITNSHDPNFSLPGTVEGRPNCVRWDICRFSTPTFDKDGTMWTSNYDMDGVETESLDLWYWTAENRRASKDAASFRPLGKIKLRGPLEGSNESEALALKLTPGFIVVAPNQYTNILAILDHKGTLENSADDEVAIVTNYYDQDGNLMTLSNVQVLSMFEDPQTGRVWVGTTLGVFNFNPGQLIKDPTRVNRIKVSRNDGTSLADYLLDGVGVSHIMQDPKGRKWFSTLGGGLVCTSSDGREVIATYTTENCEIPSDIVYHAEFNPSDNSIMVGTQNGLAQFFPNGAGASGEDLDSVSIYPNPVRPDYFGWVTIEGLTDNAVVKIADASGHVVKDLGCASGGRVTWDVCGAAGSRVSSGVYYVLASSGPDDKTLGSVGKLLVMK